MTATYRLQLRREFPFAAAHELVPYFHRLGVSHLYLSPVLAARPGSPHGYDVIDSARVNPELGGEEELRGLADALHALDMGIILDIVPNHMAASELNPYWDDVLERGRASRYADWFDIDWDAPEAKGKVVLPVLEDELKTVIARGDLRLHVRDSGARVAYRETTFPLNPATLPQALQLAQLDPAGRPAADDWAGGDEGKARLRSLLDAQQYRLAFWRDATAINYRRFFDVNDLVALRMETDAIFEDTHRLILAWVRDGVIDGLRVDHVDGLRLPSWYLATLRAAVDATRPRGTDARARFPIVVEKILSGDESLPREWPVDGTTGYDFMNEVEELFIEPEGFKAIEANYRGLRHNPSLNFRAVARDAKRRALTGPLCPDVMRVARIAHAWRASGSLEEIASAIVELIVHLDVYRTYIMEPGLGSDADKRVLADAFREARGREGKEQGVSAQALESLERAFFSDPSPADTLRSELLTRLQQLSAPATAKGVEDTALYVYVPLASRNEVGGQPDRPLADVHARVHARNAARAADWPSTLLATNTHDTKRSADLRARLDVLTGVPDDWSRHATRWRRLNKPRKRIVRGKPAPDTNSEYLYYQTLLGMWPAPRPERRADDLPDRDWIARAGERLVPYMLKAAREAKMRTSWTESDTQYEKALQAFVRETLEPHEDAPFLPDVARLTARTADDGFRFSLARVLLQCTSPGIADVYQGDELWNFTLVDPDNRRPVDFQLRMRLLSDAEAPEELLGRALAAGGVLYDNSVKLALLTKLLRFRRDHPDLLIKGEYLPISTGDQAVFAYARRSNDECCMAVARTRVAERGKEANPGRTVVLPGDLVGRWQSVLTGRAVELVRVGPQLVVPENDLVPVGQPCELFWRLLG